MYRNLVIRADINGFANSLFAIGKGNEAHAAICHVVKISGGAGVAQLNLFHTRCYLADNSRYNCSCRLAGAIGVKGARNS